jgi:hypothetical protein
MADQYIALGDTASAKMILSDLANKSIEYVTWYLSLNDSQFTNSYIECGQNMLMLDEICKSLARISSAGVSNKEDQEQSSDMALHYAKKFEELYHMFNERIGKK